MQLFKDLTIKCVGCRNYFNLTAGEQAFFAKKELSNPRRCGECRKKRREEREGEK